MGGGTDYDINSDCGGAACTIAKRSRPRHTERTRIKRACNGRGEALHNMVGRNRSLYDPSPCQRLTSYFKCNIGAIVLARFDSIGFPTLMGPGTSIVRHTGKDIFHGSMGGSAARSQKSSATESEPKDSRVERTMVADANSVSLLSWEQRTKLAVEVGKAKKIMATR